MYVTFFVNRTCPYNCKYCSARNVRHSRLLSASEWQSILSRFDADFYMCLGTEPLLYYDITNLIYELNSMGICYTLYTSLIDKYLDKLWRHVPWGVSTDVSYPEKFSRLKILEEFKNCGVDVHANFTFTCDNVQYFEKICELCRMYKIPLGVNIVHCAHDDLYDFFPRCEICDMRPSREQLKYLISIASKYSDIIQEPLDYFIYLYERGYMLRDKCCLAQISIECDGRLRTCGYRRLSYDVDVRDLSLEEIYTILSREIEKCPGCAWSCIIYACKYDRRFFFDMHRPR